jgi:alanine dehydrogenase
MSQVAGRMAVDVGAVPLLRSGGGRGMLLGGAPGVPPAKVVILGGGVAGKHAAEMALATAPMSPCSTLRPRASRSWTISSMDA